jgi:5-formyltetrahydrofolate cyclo-ligase
MILPQDSKLALRRRLRETRRGISGSEQRRHAQALARRLARHPIFLKARRIGIYWPADGEIDPRPLLQLRHAKAKRWHLPVLRTHPKSGLWFLSYRPGEAMQGNRFGIPEPARRSSRQRHAQGLDLLIIPLVGFDAACNRLGMGGGFYDRSLRYLSHHRHWRRPHLIGVAHECQHVPSLPVCPWDVPLDLVVTERRIYGKYHARVDAGTHAKP